MKAKRSFVFIIALFFLMASCGNKRMSPDNTSQGNSGSAEQTEYIFETEEEKDTASSGTPEGYSVIGGTWKVGGFYYNGSLIDVNDNEAFKSMYDTTMITFNEDGSFVYLKKYNDRGKWHENRQGAEETFLLKTESVFIYDLQNGSLVEKEVESSNKKQYIVTLMDDNTFMLNEYDAIMGKAKGGGDTFIFVKQGEASAYIAEYKVPLNNSDDQYTTASDDQSSSKVEHTNGKRASSGEKNALDKALQYLDYTAFSYSGLIEQLEYEGFSHAEAKYGADNCGADWNEQAVIKARQYLEYTSFSRSGLIDQLRYEGFTQSQAEYGVNRAY